MDFSRNTYFHSLIYCAEIRFEPPGLSCAVCVLLSMVRYGSVKPGKDKWQCIAVPQVAESIFESGILVEKAEKFLNVKLPHFNFQLMSYIDTVG